MTFEVTILGSNSALPAHDRYPTSQILNAHDKLYMIDCGEATQIQLTRYHVKPGKIEHIFISHLHGDHYFGLMGLLTSYSLNRRTKPITIHGPVNLDTIINTHLELTNTKLSYELHFNIFEPENGKVIYEEDNLVVTSLEMIHRLPCSGFIFREKNDQRHIIKEKLDEYQIPYELIPELKKGNDIKLDNGMLIPNDECTTDPDPTRSYAFCTDTAYNEELVSYLKGVDLLYHEATFDKSRIDRAAETGHSTSVQAGKIARQAAVKKLIIGHFSSRYLEDDLDNLVAETQAVFPNSELAIEGITFKA